MLLGQTTATTTTVDAGAALLDQDRVAAVVAPTVGAEWRLDAVRSTVRASAAATFASPERWAVQGVGAGSWFSGPAYAPREVGVVASVLRLIGVPTTATANILARQHLSRGSTGGWAGASIGAAARGSGNVAPVLALDGALWRRGERWSGR